MKWLFSLSQWFHIVQCTAEIISTRSSWYNPSQKRGNYDSGGGNYTLSTLVSKCTIIIIVRLQSMDVHYIGIDWRDLQSARFCVFGIQRLPGSPVIPQSIHSLLCWGSAITALSNARSTFQDLGSPTSVGSTSCVSHIAFSFAIRLTTLRESRKIAGSKWRRIVYFWNHSRRHLYSSGRPLAET